MSKWADICLIPMQATSHAGDSQWTANGKDCKRGKGRGGILKERMGKNGGNGGKKGNAFDKGTSRPVSKKGTGEQRR